MDTKKLFSMQKELDRHIELQHGLMDEDLFDRKVLALTVEIGELANETRCFKFWSVKPSSEFQVIIEEFVDGIHFILSLGIECGFDHIGKITADTHESVDINGQFLTVYESIHTFRGSRQKDDYLHLFASYMKLAKLLGLSESQIEQAYIEKNEVNYDRQRRGY
jgi:dimeric dUTPase (all-alpha-NTP-PPase superfamily)